MYWSMHTIIRLITAGALLSGLQGHVSALPLYTITDLGSLGGTSTAGEKINASGQIVGLSQIGTSLGSHAFLYSNGIMQDLGTFGGSSSRAFGINDAGHVVGHAAKASGGSSAFLYDGTDLIDLGPVIGTSSTAYDINQGGQIAGFMVNNDFKPHAFLYDPGSSTTTDLGTLPGDLFSFAYSINDIGQIVGLSQSGSGPRAVGRAFLYDSGPMVPLGTLGGPGSVAYAINNSGQVVGAGSTTQIISNQSPLHYATHAFLYEAGAMSDLGTLGGTSSVAYDINNLGQIVGASSGSDGFARAFLYEAGSMLDLNLLLDVQAAGWDSLGSAHGINATGQITGTGSMNGEQHAFLLTPVSAPNSQVPEPPVSMLMLAGVIGLLAVTRRKSTAPFVRS